MTTSQLESSKIDGKLGVGDKVMWGAGGGDPQNHGTIKKVYTKKVTYKGITKNGTKDNPAFLIEDANGNMLIKSASEVQQSTWGEEAQITGFLYKKGDLVQWAFGENRGKGTIKELYNQEISLVINDISVTRKGTQENPALLIEDEDGNQVLKLASEIDRNPNS